MDYINSHDFNLILVPDAGSNDYEAHAELKQKGMDIIILDHHLADKISEDAYVVNNQLSDYPNKELSGVGVTYQFCKYLDNNTMPDGICFDHDLGDESYTITSTNEITRENTGDSAAKYLVEKCISTNTRLPKFSSQSSNPVGRENIISYLNNFVKHNPDLSPG